MEARISSSLGLPSPNPHRHPTDFPSILNHFAATATTPNGSAHLKAWSKGPNFAKNFTVVERAPIDAAGGGIVSTFTYVCLHPLDTTNTKMQIKVARYGVVSGRDGFFGKEGWEAGVAAEEEELGGGEALELDDVVGKKNRIY
ncbi:hypothetical protein PIB30_093853 [Stylosanthes scabra]|uniref:Uncharacterized protein n=1 Tax=Stylosanthes scabra TaxID=79078 RepID=A0ABU6ZTW7_9FABA|nr:hypothetical protein [Stylosanthes scabra]